MDCVGSLAPEIQFLQVFSAAIVAGSGEVLTSASRQEYGEPGWRFNPQSHAHEVLARFGKAGYAPALRDVISS